MENYLIAEQLTLLAKLMDIHGENSFKAKSYSAAAFTLEKLPYPLAGKPLAKIVAIRGIGESVGAKIAELLETGQLKALTDIVAQTPAGVLEMMSIKGLGPKKIHTLWKELQISSLAELETACQEGRIASQKGFGEKTQTKILEGIRFVQENKGLLRYAEAEVLYLALQAKLEAHFPEHSFTITGAIRRQLETVAVLEWVTTVPVVALKNYLVKEDTAVTAEKDSQLDLVVNDSLPLRFYSTSPEQWTAVLFTTSASPAFLQTFGPVATTAGTEEELFTAAGWPFIPPFRREDPAVKERILNTGVVEVIQTADIKGLIHSHSTWSDGVAKIEDMARELIRLGFEYLVISDHSKAAAYANGLDEERIRQQHQEIDALNTQLAPFRIFKSIECDILGDGTMDYSNDVLASFDLVIASVHSNLDMDEEKAMERLLGAVSNPYVTILGHPTGRLVARRKGYPVDHTALIDACAANSVVIEINASPYRLDLDWRYIEYALDKGVTLSINPDAHALEEFAVLKYGVLVAQKGGLTKAQNLSSYNLAEFEAFLAKRKVIKGLH